MVELDFLDLLPITYMKYEKINADTIKVEGVNFTADFGQFKKWQGIDPLYIDMYRNRMYTLGGTEQFFDITVVVRD